MLIVAYLDPGEADTGLSALAVAGIVAGAVILLVLAVLALRFFWRSERAARD